ncbi:hypothetical protein [Paenibacillus sp. P22]|uniref:hypothetical protein n=1 Tax=Paenibacillus sp. P22 TaxID=483908 RepID=UPI00038FFD96|nr:hypothetical protein [Paenibacillus sp. P22]CDN43477.1 Predicted protein [Paenibacillus sp. P22]
MYRNTTEEIRVDIADLKERLRQHRIESGRNPDPPPRPKFVDVPLSIAMVERLKPFRQIAVKYAAIIADGRAVRVDTDKFAEYERLSELLCFSKGFWSTTMGGFVRNIKNVMNKVNNAIDEDSLEDFDLLAEARKLAIMFRIFDDIRVRDHDGYAYYAENRDILRFDETNRMCSDEEAYQAAFDEAWAHYQTIKDEEYD